MQSSPPRAGPPSSGHRWGRAAAPFADSGTIRVLRRDRVRHGRVHLLEEPHLYDLSTTRSLLQQAGTAIANGRHADALSLYNSIVSFTYFSCC